MAQANQQGRMQNFVHGRNATVASADNGAVSGKKASLEELKEYPSGIHRPNHGNSTNNNVRSSKATPHIKLEPDTTRAQHGSRRQSDDQGRFFDTDAESIDDTSTAASFNEQAANPGDEDQSEYASSEVDDEQHLDDQERQLNAPRGRDLRLLDTEVKSGQHGLPNGRELPYTKGDSYPTTTSGNSSIPDLRNEADFSKVNVQTTRYNVQHRQQRHELATGSNSNWQGQVQSKVPPPGPNRTENGLFARPNGSDLDNVQQQANGGFTYATAPKLHANTNPPRTHQQTASLNASAPKPSTNAAQSSSSTATVERSHHAFSGQQQQGAVIAGKTSAQFKSGSTVNRRLLQAADGEQARLVKPAPVVEDLMDNTLAAAHVEDAAHSSQYHGTESELDYDVDELRNMDLHVLRDQPFDVNPHAHEDSPKPSAKVVSISTKLGKVKNTQHDVQTAFFKSLPIDEWEQAGDWFLEQFSAAVGRLKEVRQQRRKAAQEFENEIGDRYKAVGQKRKHIDMAMSEMKESGDKVLAGTPKKSQRK